MSDRTARNSGNSPVTEPLSERENRLADALQRVLEWPLPNGTVETWALPEWLAKIAREALDAATE